MDWQLVLDAAQAGRLANVLVGSNPAAVARVLGGAGFVYVATPYSREAVDDAGLWDYYRSIRLDYVAARAVNDLRVAGVSAISPIVESHMMVAATGRHQALGHTGAVAFVPAINPMDGAAWLRWCLPIVAAASAVVVPDLPGWDKSAGIKAEVRAAIDQRKPVFIYASEVLA
jgi:hypothetical protein